MIRRFMAEIDYFEALAQMYDANENRELSRSALQAAQSIKRLMDVVIEARRRPERSGADRRQARRLESKLGPLALPGPELVAQR